MTYKRETNTVLRAGAVAALISMTVFGAAYAATSKTKPETQTPGTTATTNLALPAIGQMPERTGQKVNYTLVVDSQSHEQSTAAHTWGQALLDAGVTVDTITGDQVSVGLENTPVAGTTVHVQHVTVTAESKTDKDPHGTVEEETDTLNKGERKVKSPGVDGMTHTTYLVRSVGGQEMSREVSSQVVAAAKVDEVVQVGTRTKTPKADKPDTPNTSNNTAGASDDVWAKLAQCESDGKPTTNTGNGYYGMYQFTKQTWKSLGGEPEFPSEASAEKQTEMAKKLQARSGWGQWPACARKLGLL